MGKFFIANLVKPFAESFYCLVIIQEVRACKSVFQIIRAKDMPTVRFLVIYCDSASRCDDSSILIPLVICPVKRKFVDLFYVCWGHKDKGLDNCSVVYYLDPLIHIAIIFIYVCANRFRRVFASVYQVFCKQCGNFFVHSVVVCKRLLLYGLNPICIFRPC